MVMWPRLCVSQKAYFRAVILEHHYTPFPRLVFPEPKKITVLLRLFFFFFFSSPWRYWYPTWRRLSALVISSLVIAERGWGKHEQWRWHVEREPMSVCFAWECQVLRITREPMQAQLPVITPAVRRIIQGIRRGGLECHRKCTCEHSQ